jgi:hypothetical protein
MISAIRAIPLEVCDVSNSPMVTPKGWPRPIASFCAVLRYVRCWVNSGSNWSAHEMTRMTHRTSAH